MRIACGRVGEKAAAVPTCGLPAVPLRPLTATTSSPLAIHGKVNKGLPEKGCTRRWVRSRDPRPSIEVLLCRSWTRGRVLPARRGSTGRVALVREGATVDPRRSREAAIVRCVMKA